MIDATRTTTVLLDGLFDSGNEEVWAEFDTRYRPLLIAVARRLGLADADAADVAQDTLVKFIDEYRAGRYDRSRGRLRSWLVSIERTQIAQRYRSRAARAGDRGDSALVFEPDEAEMTTIWDAERRSLILREAMAALRSSTRLGEDTIRAFELLVVQQLPVEAVSETLGLSRHDVYLAKSRVAQRLRGIMTRLENAYDEGAG